MRRAAILILSALALAACGDDDPLSPENRVPAQGQYAYTFDAGSVTASGVMVITGANEEELDGVFDVSAYDGRFVSIGWNIDAYVVYAYPNIGGTAIHRFAPDGDGGLECEEARHFRQPGDSPIGVCTVEYIGE